MFHSPFFSNCGVSAELLAVPGDGVAMATGMLTCFLVGVAAVVSLPVAVMPEGGDFDPNFAPFVDPLD